MTYIIGIDPGLKGGLAFLEGGKFYSCHPMPTNNKGVDTERLNAIIINYVLDTWGDVFVKHPTAYIEKQHTRGNQGGNFTIGTNYGRILAVLELLSIPYVEVNPQEWQAAMLTGWSADTKEAAILYCQNLGWAVPTRSNRADSPLNDGISDALVIAAYGAELARIEAMKI